MDGKGGTLFLLVIVCFCSVLGSPLDIENNPLIKENARNLMKKCQHMGYTKPDIDQMTSVFGGSYVATGERKPDSSTTVLSTFLSVLGSVSSDTSPAKAPGKPGYQLSNFTSFPRMIEKIRNVSAAPGCYMNALMAPMSWEALSSGGDDNMDSSDFQALLSTAKPLLLDNPPRRLDLPKSINTLNLNSMMNTLKDVYEKMSEEQRSEVMSWARDQITQKYFNCTKTNTDKCNSSLKWLTSPVFRMIGPYLSSLSDSDLDFSPQDNFCIFFQSSEFKGIMYRIDKINPSLAKRLLSKIQLCFTDNKGFLDNLDKLGPLACFYENPPQLTPAMSLILLSEMSRCDNPAAIKLKQRLMNYATANTNVTNAETIRKLGSAAKFLTAKQLSSLNVSEVFSLVKNSSIEWTKRQKQILMEKYLGEKKCSRELTGQELMDLAGTVEGMPSCVFKKIKSSVLDPEVLKNMSQGMRKDQAVAMLQGLGKDLNASQLMEMLPDGLLQAVPLKRIEKANFSSWDNVPKKIWRLGQAACIAQKMKTAVKYWYRNMGSVVQGITCGMIENVTSSEVQEMANGITDAPQWLSKVQAGCAAWKLFATLESQRADYFRTITPEELSNISTPLLIHLPPEKVNGLPDSVCPVFLNMMQTANNLSSLPCLSPSRSALTQRALLCLGTNMSIFTTDDMYKLGPLLCEVPPSKLRLLNPDVLKSSLQALASCQYIPKQHWATLLQLLNQTFGDPSEWTASTMEKLGPLLFMDDNATFALPKKAWMKDVISYLIQRSANVSDALKNTLFNLTVSGSTSTGARRRRAVNSTVSGNYTIPTVELIRELGKQNVYWTPEQLDAMTLQTFTETVEVLGDVSNYSPQQLAVLSKKATEAWGAVENMNESLVAQLQCITQAYSSDQLQRVAFTLTTLEHIAACGWNNSQISAVWKGVAKYNNLTVQLLDASDMVALDRFICGLTSTEIKQLNSSAFMDAVASMDGTACPSDVAQNFKVLIVSAVGQTSTWTEAQVSDIGSFIAGLNASELASLNVSVFPFISKNSIPLIPPGNLAALTIAKLEALGPDSAAMVTTAQRAALTTQQRAAIDRSLTGTRQQTVPDAGTTVPPSQAGESIYAVSKPLLFFLLGLLLL